MKNHTLKTLWIILLTLTCLDLHAQEKKLNIITSFLPLYAHTKSIAGEMADVTMLLDKNTGPHDFAPKPSDIQKLAQADLLIINGLGLDSWAQELAAKTGNAKLRIIDSSKGIPLLDSPAELELTPHQHDHGHHHHHHGEGKTPTSGSIPKPHSNRFKSSPKPWPWPTPKTPPPISATPPTTARNSRHSMPPSPRPWPHFPKKIWLPSTTPFPT
ncbi:MAG: zinc ABC transporter solute-binding protein [Blastochloris sp.]|nr:zinc ABC transporter solute-binding protein [Blastochloris sp.]